MGANCCRHSTALEEHRPSNVPRVISQQPKAPIPAISDYSYANYGNSALPSPLYYLPDNREFERRAEKRRAREQDVFEYRRQLEQDERDDEMRRRRQAEEDAYRYESNLREIRSAVGVHRYDATPDVYTPTSPRDYGFGLTEKLATLEAGIQGDERRHQMRLAEQHRRYEESEAEHHRRMEDLQDEFDEAVRRIRQDYQKRRTEMSEQYATILKAMQIRVWNDIIERNWTNRLNSLRNAGRDSEKLQAYCLTPRGEIVGSRLEEWRHTLKVLQNVMSNESANMSEMHTVTQKTFLLDIKKAVERVIRCCQNLLSALWNPKDVHSLKSQADELRRACLEIPTLSELKHNYYAEMRPN